MPRKRGRKRGKPFLRGIDPRRHELTREERSRGGLTTAKRYLCAAGRWHLDWYDRCDRKVRGDDGEFYDGEEEDDRHGPDEWGPD